MTEDYKKKLLQYLLGKTPQEEGTEEPIFNESSVDVNIKSSIKVELEKELNQNVIDLLTLGKIHDETLNKWLIYGIYSIGTEDNPQYHGYVYIIDEKLNKVAILIKYTSGTYIFPLTAMNRDENGYYYALSLDYSDSKTRVLLFNNIIGSGALNGNYNINLRKSYVTPYNYSIFSFRQNRIKKVNGKALYYIIHHEEKTNIVNTVITSFEIGTSGENKWQDVRLDSLVDSNIFDVLISIGEDEIIFKIYGLQLNLTGDNDNYVEYSVINNSYTKDKIISLNGKTQSFLSQTIVQDINNVYLSVADYKAKKTFIYKVIGTSLNKIYESDVWTTVEEGSLPSPIYMELVNNNIFLNGIFQKETYDYITTGMLVNDSVYLINTHNNQKGTIGLHDYVNFYVLNTYNLYNIYVPIYQQGIENKSSKVTVIYNKLNYNGNPYSNINSLYPQSSVLYDTNSNPVFARNLYNKTLNNNNMQTTLEIPNNYLNDTMIKTQTLFGQTKNSLIVNEKTISKNVYERLFINFYNSLVMANENTEERILNVIGATRLNQSINDKLDYSSQQATKVRINYEDGTMNITNSTITFIDDTHAKIQFNVINTESNPITNIEIISNDESTVYQNITNLSLEVNKNYSITQNVKII